MSGSVEDRDLSAPDVGVDIDTLDWQCTTGQPPKTNLRELLVTIADEHDDGMSVIEQLSVFDCAKLASRHVMGLGLDGGGKPQTGIERARCEALDGVRPVEDPRDCLAESPRDGCPGPDRDGIPCFACWQAAQGDSEGANPRETGGETGFGRAISRRTLYPATLMGREWWTPTALDSDQRKRPRAPHLHDHSYPAEWNADLPDEDRPETDFETTQRWASLAAYELAALGCSLPETDHDQTLSIGLILPKERPPIEKRVTVIDWDDVRDPETGEIHPVCAAFLERYSVYADISRSGTGIHQWVIGGLKDRGKFITGIDDEPFIGDDIPQAEIYDGGRHVWMSGRYIDGSGKDIEPAQDLIDDIIERFTPDEQGSTEVSDSLSTDQQTIQATTFTPPEEPPDDGKPLCYHSALMARGEPPASATLHDVNLAIGALGLAAGYDTEEIDEHIRTLDKDAVGYDEDVTAEQLEHIDNGNYSPPRTTTLYHAGILDSPGCEPTCPIHAPGIGDSKRSQHAPGDGENYSQMPTWALRTVAYHAGHDPSDDIWRDAETGKALTDSADDAAELQDAGIPVYRALPARIHNIVIDILDDAGRSDDHGRGKRTVSDDLAVRGNR